MKLQASLKRMCSDHKIVRRNGQALVICDSEIRHKQRQG